MYELINAPALSASLLAAAVSTAGIVALTYQHSLAERASHYLIGLAAGLLLGTACLHLIPESMDLSPNAPTWILTAYLVFLAIAALGHTRAGPSNVALLIPVLGISLHSFVDGMIYTATFAAGPSTGLSAVAGLILHEFPEGMILYALAIGAGLRRSTAFTTALVGAALTTPFGALLSMTLLELTNTNLLGQLLAMSAGALLFVGGTHLVPTLLAKRFPFAWGLFALGIALAYFVAISAH